MCRATGDGGLPDPRPTPASSSRTPRSCWSTSSPAEMVEFDRRRPGLNHLCIELLHLGASLAKAGPSLELLLLQCVDLRVVSLHSTKIRICRHKDLLSTRCLVGLEPFAAYRRALLQSTVRRAVRRQAPTSRARRYNWGGGTFMAVLEGAAGWPGRDRILRHHAAAKSSRDGALPSARTVRIYASLTHLDRYVEIAESDIAPSERDCILYRP